MNLMMVLNKRHKCNKKALRYQNTIKNSGQRPPLFKPMILTIQDGGFTFSETYIHLRWSVLFPCTGRELDGCDLRVRFPGLTT